MLRVTMLALCALVLLLASMAQGAAVPQKINYQAVLLDQAGDPVTDPVNLTFSIYDVDVGGTPLWTQTLNGVQPDANGQFSVILGNAINPISHEVLTGGQLWLGIQVEGDAEEMSPRAELVSSAYSFRVNTVDQAEAGTIYGSLTVEESASKLEDARVIVSCAAKGPDAVEINPCDGVILKATNQTGEEVLLAEVDNMDQDALMTMIDPGTDAQASYSATAAEFGTSLAKALQKKYVYGGAGFQHLGASETDVLGQWAEMAPGQTYIGMTDYSSKAAGASIKIRPPSVDLADVFTIQTSTGDPTFNLQSDPDEGAQISFYTPNVARASAEKTRVGNLGLSFFGDSDTEELLMIEEETPGVVSITGMDYSAKAAGASFKISPPSTASNDVFTVRTSTGDPSFQLQTNPSGATSMSFDNPSAKTANRLMLNNNGVYFVNVAKGETLMTITSEGNVIGKGQIAMGQNVSNDGFSANVLGYLNSADGDSAGVSGGYDNSASGHASQISGGAHNDASGPWSFVGGGYHNTASGDRSTVCAGGLNTADTLLATVGGGWSNDASGEMSTVAGGIDNAANAYAATVGGGWNNIADLDFSTVGGGSHNVASGEGATIGGGSDCKALAVDATVGGGYYDTANGQYSTVGGGSRNAATGDYSTIPGGSGNRAEGDMSFAAGRRAKALHDGCFVWGDNTGSDFASTANNQFLIRADYMGVSTNSPTAKLDLNGSTGYNQLRMRTSYTPTGTSDTHGNVGDIAWDSNYIYVKTSAGWKRAALSTW